MLLVKTYLAKSRIRNAGMGVFAGEDIRKGQKVWEFDARIDIELTFAQIAALPKATRQNLYKYLWLRDPRKRKVTLCADLGKFINHSDNANLDDTGPCNFANRDIKAGTELTCNYNDFDDCAATGIPSGGKPRQASPLYRYEEIIEGMAIRRQMARKR